jgi:hypothetical protein
MRKTHLYVSLVVVAVATITASTFLRDGRQERKNPGSQVHPTPWSAQPVSAVVLVDQERGVTSGVDSSRENEGNPRPPEEFSGFWLWDEERRLELVTDWQADARLSDDIIRFVRQCIRVKELSPATRNNLANALLNQADSRADVADLFREMVLDEHESDHWREYALQHLAVSLTRSASTRNGVDLFWTIASDAKNALAGTALLQLNRLEESGVTRLDHRYDDLLVERARGDGGTLLDVRTTAIALMGERRVVSGVDLVRDLLRNPSASIRRVSAAALGSMGEVATDGPLLRTLLGDVEPLVATAAGRALVAIYDRGEHAPGVADPQTASPNSTSF